MARVTIEEQEKLGLRGAAGQVVVEPQVKAQIQQVVAQRKQQAEIMPLSAIELSVTPNATANVDFRTSAQDRAWGFLIASTPRTFVFSLAITLISMLATDIGVIAGIVILVSIFSVVELASYICTLAISAEGTAYREAMRKWDVVEREQRERWAHYKRLTEKS